MYGKIQITGEVEILTGMHIGTSNAFAAIGAVDSPVIRDIRTGRPMLPGSSLKGKLRSLLAKKYNPAPTKHENDTLNIQRLFGSSKKDDVKPSRLIFSDMFIPEKAAKEITSYELTGFTEVKFENTINRMTAVANPRQIERVIRGTEFGLDIIYELNHGTELNEAEEDFALLCEGLKLLEYDYLGGHGSRGYGKVHFKNLKANAVAGEIPEELTNKINDGFKNFNKGQ